MNPSQPAAPAPTSLKSQLEEVLELCTNDKMSTLARITNIRRIVRGILEAAEAKEKAKEGAVKSGIKKGDPIQAKNIAAPEEAAI